MDNIVQTVGAKPHAAAIAVLEAARVSKNKLIEEFASVRPLISRYPNFNSLLADHEQELRVLDEQIEQAERAVALAQHDAPILELPADGDDATGWRTAIAERVLLLSQQVASLKAENEALRKRMGASRIAQPMWSQPGTESLLSSTAWNGKLFFAFMGLKESVLFGFVRCYDPVANQWEELPEFGSKSHNELIRGTKLGGFEGDLYATHEHSSPGKAAEYSIERYDSAHNVWMPVNGDWKLYAQIHGLNAHYDASEGTAGIYDASSKQWRVVSLPTQRLSNSCMRVFPYEDDVICIEAYADTNPAPRTVAPPVAHVWNWAANAWVDLPLGWRSTTKETENSWLSSIARSAPGIFKAGSSIVFLLDDRNRFSGYIDNLLQSCGLDYLPLHAKRVWGKAYFVNVKLQWCVMDLETQEKRMTASIYTGAGYPTSLDGNPTPLLTILDGQVYSMSSQPPFQLARFDPATEQCFT